MKILYYFRERPSAMYLWQRFHIFDELLRKNISIQVFNPEDYPTIEVANSALLTVVKRGRFDLFMTPHADDLLFLDSLSNVRRSGVPTLLICFDNLVIPFAHQRIARHFDLVWLTSRETEPMFKKWGARTIVQPYAANPGFCVPGNESEVLTVGFVGTPYGSRANTINTLTSNDIDVTLYSDIYGANATPPRPTVDAGQLVSIANLTRFPIGRRILLGALKQRLTEGRTLRLNDDHLRIQSAVELPRLPAAYSVHALSLASTAARNTGILANPVRVVNLRSFEIPMSGGVQFCEFSPELSEYFASDSEIVFYRSSEELVEKARFYLRSNNSHLRSSIRRNARMRAANEHTWSIRFRRVFSHLGLSWPSA